MRYRYTLALALLGGAAAQSAPLPNLVLTCSDENSIGQEACEGIWSYEIPTNDLIVATGSFGSSIWVRASDLAGSNTVAICVLPVEPGEYSSCRDEAGVRRITYVPKDTVFPDGGNSVTVSKIGGDYTDPVTAAANAFAGDTWCVSPQWPEQPCVMGIAQGIFILPETLVIPDGLVVSGAGKGDTMLVADNGIETAVSSLGNVRITGLTIVNSQPGGARTTGLDGLTRPSTSSRQFHDVAIHVAGSAQNAATEQGLVLPDPRLARHIAIVNHGDGSLEILDSEISAAGQDALGIRTTSGDLTLERSRVSAAWTFDDAPESLFETRTARLVDSQLFGAVSFFSESSRLEIVRSGIVGNVRAGNDATEIVITDSTIKGNVATHPATRSVSITDTIVEGNVSGGHRSIFDGLTVQGAVTLTRASVRRSYINSTSTAPALLLTANVDFPDVLLEQTFVQGVQAVAAGSFSKLSVSSSVLAGSVSGPGGALTCTDTYGADYELLSESCQPQAP